MRFACIVSALLCLLAPARADETDQYPTWGVQLADSAPAINHFVNARIRETLADLNAPSLLSADCEKAVDDIFSSIYLDRLRADLTDFAEESATIDVYPPRTVLLSEVRDLSIYQAVTFPNLIRIARTIRVGDVYMGIDKLAHFFGFGRRYFLFYKETMQLGQTSEDALDLAILLGIFSENTVLGKGVNGIFSLADLEANYRGFLMARDFCEGETPYLKSKGKSWQLMREVDLRNYINPLFDESYNPSVYTEDVLTAVSDVLAETYAARTSLPDLAARFRKYREASIESRSIDVIRRHFSERGYGFQRQSTLSALGLEPGHPVAPFDP